MHHPSRLPWDALTGLAFIVLIGHMMLAAEQRTFRERVRKKENGTRLLRVRKPVATVRRRLFRRVVYGPP